MSTKKKALVSRLNALCSQLSQWVEDDSDQFEKILEEINSIDGFHLDGKRFTDFVTDPMIQLKVVSHPWPSAYSLVSHGYGDVEPPVVLMTPPQESRVCEKRFQCQSHLDHLCNGMMHIKDTSSRTILDYRARPCTLTIRYKRLECPKHLKKDNRLRACKPVFPNDICSTLINATYRLLATALLSMQDDRRYTPVQVIKHFKLNCQCVYDLVHLRDLCKQRANRLALSRHPSSELHFKVSEAPMAHTSMTA